MAHRGYLSDSSAAIPFLLHSASATFFLLIFENARHAPALTPAISLAYNTLPPDFYVVYTSLPSSLHVNVTFTEALPDHLHKIAPLAFLLITVSLLPSFTFLHSRYSHWMWHVLVSLCVLSYLLPLERYCLLTETMSDSLLKPQCSEHWSGI